MLNSGPPMANIALKEGIPPSALSRARRQRLWDSFFHFTTLFFALLVLALLGGVMVSLAMGSWPAFRSFGLGFLVTEVWNPVTDKFGRWARIYGTLVTSLSAMLIGVPASFGI